MNSVATFFFFHRNKNPSPPMEVVRQCIPALLALLQKGDNEIDADACWVRSRVRNRGVRVREFAVVFPFTLPCPFRVEQ